MDTLRSLRQPAAWVILGVVGAKGLVALVMMLTSLDHGVARATQTWSGSVIGALSAVLVVAVLLSLVLVTPRPPQTKLLVTLGLGVVAGLGVISLIGAFIGLADIGGGGSSLVVWFLRRLLDLALVALSAFVLLRVMVAVTAEMHGSQHGAGMGTSTQVVEPQGYRQHTLPPQPPGHAQQPAQQRPDAGAMWGSASQAATGSQVSGWGSGQASGWGTPQSLPPQGSATPHSLPPQPPNQPQHRSYQQQPHGHQSQGQYGQQAPHGQQPPQGTGPADDGPPEDYTRIAPRRQV